MTETQSAPSGAPDQNQTTQRPAKRRKLAAAEREPEKIRVELNIEKWPGIWQPAKAHTKVALRTLERHVELRNGDRATSKLLIGFTELGTLTTEDPESKPWSMTFYPFGVTFSSTGTFNQNLRLPGMIFDTETGLYHDGAREYSPELGRYFQTDPIGLDSGSTNTYAYANNNPLRLIDTSGTFSYISAGVRDAIDNLTPTASPFSGLTIAGTLSDAKTIDNAAFFARLAGLPIKDNPVATVCLGLADAYSTYQMALTQHSYAGLAATYAGLANVAALIGSEIYSIAATAWEVAFPHPQPEDLSHPYELAFPAPILPLVHTRQ